MRRSFVDALRCPACQGRFELEAVVETADAVEEGVLSSSCSARFPVIGGVPRILPADLAPTLLDLHPAFFRRHPGLRPPAPGQPRPTSVRTLRAFGDEWQRFPALEAVHERVFGWYFEGPRPVAWAGLSALDAGCGMGRWLHFARRTGARVVGMDVSSAVDVAARREGPSADFVQADLRWPPFSPAAFDLVYSLGVVHHLEDPAAGVRALAGLVRPGGELRLYVYRSLEGEPAARRALLALVRLARRVTTRLPFATLHGFSWLVAGVATALFLQPRRVLRRLGWGDRLTRGLPLVQYADVPFRMLVAEQFDRFGAPLEGRYRREQVEAWLREVAFEVEAVLPGLGWRVVGRRPLVTPGLP